MDHRDAIKYIYAFLDGRLSDEERLALEKHIDSCSNCKKRIAYEIKLRSVLKESLLKEKTPFYLKEKIRSEIEKIDKETFIWQKFRIPSQLRPLFSLMLAGLIFLGISSGIFFYKWQKSTRETDVFSLLAAKHIVFATRENPAEMSSSDVEELIAWFKGKVNFAFSVPFFSEGPDLLGGRLSELRQKGAVHLIYQRGDCRFSFFIFKSTAKDFPAASRKKYKGKECYIARYNDQLIILWRSNGVGCALVSDDEKELFEVAPQIM